eukprot:454686_1
MTHQKEQTSLKHWCTERYANGSILYKALMHFGYDDLSQLKSSSTADLRQLENDISNEYNIKTSFTQLKRNNYITSDIKHSQEIYGNLLLEPKEKSTLVIDQSKTNDSKNISISKYKFHDSKLIRVKKYIFIHFDGKWVRIQFIEGTKSIYILKRIFH